jgi:medium-chain acyl-[acyl-carrier-protein] hydrolase
MPRGADGIHYDDFRVHTWDIDVKNQATLQALLRFMQETAMNDADEMDSGYEALHANGHTWVLVGLLIQCDAYPLFQSRLRVKVWLRAQEGLATLRDFVLEDEQGREFARATSSWLVLDIAERRPVKPDLYMERARPWHPRRAVGRDPARLEPVEGWDRREELLVRYADLDMNGHVNNVHYPMYVQELLPYAWRLEHDVAEIEMNFLAEARHDDVLESRLKTEPAGILHLHHGLFRRRDDREIFRARTIWR